MRRLPELLARLRAELPHLVALMVVDLDTSSVVGGGSVDPGFDPAIAASGYTDVVRADVRLLEALGQGAAEDILLTSAELYVVLRMIGPKHYVCAAVTRSGTPGFVRTLLRRQDAALREAIGAP